MKDMENLNNKIGSDINYILSLGYDFTNPSILPEFERKIQKRYGAREKEFKADDYLVFSQTIFTLDDNIRVESSFDYNKMTVRLSSVMIVDDGRRYFAEKIKINELKELENIFYNKLCNDNYVWKVL